MRRRLLLIVAPNAIPQKPLDGPVADLMRWYEYLLSPRGGAWHPDEIRYLVDPSPLQLSLQLAWVKRAELAGVVFSGHGYTRVEQGSASELILAAGPQLEWPLTQLVPWSATWSFTVVDACRDVQRVRGREKLGEVAGLDGLRTVSSRRAHRELYERRVRATRPHAEIVLATGLGSSAKDLGAEGGLFTSEFLTDAADWQPENWWEPTSQSVQDCVSAASSAVLRRSGYSQSPRWVTTVPRTGSLPFSVVVPATVRAAAPLFHQYW